MAQFTIYRSSDASAPVLHGDAGSLITVLDACLVNGYGAQSAAGWTKAFSGTNKAAYRGGSGVQHYLRVQDDAPHGTALGREARIRGFETMSDVDTGTGDFPDTTQQTNGLIVRKSAATGTTARDWIIFADDRTIYGFFYSADVANVPTSWMFGEGFSLQSGDAFNTIITARTGANENSNVVTVTQENLTRLAPMSATASTRFAGLAHYMPRGYTGTGGSAHVGKHGDMTKGDGASTGQSYLNGLVPYPNPEDGGLMLSPIWIHDPNTAPSYNIRGRMRGFWHFLHDPSSVADGDVFAGVGELSGKSFTVVKVPFVATVTRAVCIIETSNTLETN
jgi:hypothetical protein